MALIKFTNTNNSIPYRNFILKYDEALKNHQENIQAVVISSYNKVNNEVESRFVNLKMINAEEWIFYSNYNSRKAKDFFGHNQISAILFWSKINIQIRIKAHVKKIKEVDSDLYFKSRSIKKNALSISSNQSSSIDCYSSVKNLYQETLLNKDCHDRPEYWGGYSFKPYYFEFWEGHKSRLNKRDIYEIKEGDWEHSILQP